MGNQQSAASQNRLSKPKTNTNSPSPALKVDSPVSVTSRYADLSARGRQQIRETMLSPVDTDFGTAAFSNKDDGIDGTAAHTSGRPVSVISRSNSRSNSLSCFGSRHGSSTKLTAFADSKVSLVSTGQADLDAAIKFLQEFKRNGSPEDLAALHEALAPLEEHAVPVVEPALSRRNSVINRSSSSLTRRRSMVQTPGMATRNSPVEGRRKTWNSWKAPNLDPEEEAKWRAGSRAALPFNRLTDFALAEDSRDTPTPRAQTPGEMDYSHLGSLKLGSLVVTNGAPSPAPSAIVSKQSSRLAGQDDYFSATEAGASPLMMKTTRRRGHVKSKSSVLPATAPIHYYLGASNNESTPTKLKYTQPQVTSSTQPFDDQLETEPAKPLRVTNHGADNHTNSANRLAQSYQAEISASSFEKLKQSYRNEPDEGFASDDPMSFQEEVAQLLAGTMFSEPTTGAKMSGAALSSTTPRIPASVKPRPRGPQRPLPQTADSGYSSGGSLHLVNREQHKDALSSVSAQRSDSPLKMDSAKVDQSELPTILQMGVQTVGSEQSVSAIMPANQAQPRPPPLTIPDQSARSSARSSISEAILSPQTPRSTASKASLDSTSSVTQKRMHRGRSSQPDLPVVQSCQPIPEGTIPEVPHSVRAKFVRRLSHAPGIEYLTHTYPSKDHVLAHEPASNPPRTMSTVNSQFMQLEPDRPPKPPAHSRRMSFSMFRRKSAVNEKQAAKKAEDTSPDLVDLVTIASALRTSPYDAAMSGPQKKTTTASTHPHQLGKTLSRAKSLVNMDSQAATEFARMRSKDRALVQREVPPQRRRSYHNLKMEVGEAKVSKRHPQSSFQDIPPVPSLDTCKLHSARPQSANTSQRETAPDPILAARSRERGQVVVPQLVDKSDDYRQSPSQPQVDWEAHAQAWRMRRKSIGEGLRMKNELGEVSASTVNSRTKLQPPEDMASWGRYSGGLGYGYEERGIGVGGSAGTRAVHSVASNKSLHWRHQYGVDMSDVPIMLQRV